MSSSPRFSADGLFYWDGSQWVPRQLAPAPTGRPMQTPESPLLGRVPTSWTRPLQYSVAGFYVVVATWWTVTAIIVAVHVPAFVTQFIAQQEALHPDQPLPPPGYDTGMDTTIFFGLAFAVIVVIGAAATIVAGAIRRWTWMYYAVLFLLAAQALSLPLVLFDLVRIPDVLGGNKLLRAGMTALGFLALFLLGQLLGALIRQGPWAARKVLPGQ